jgi:23S rRNA pseudouridine955/2504/2580 synthase
MSESSEKILTARYLTVDSSRVGQRLDNLLLAELRGVPRSLVYRVLRTGEVRVNRGRVKPGYRVAAGDQVRIPPLRLPAPDAPLPVPEPLLRQLQDAILHEDARLLVLDKPSGLAVHGGSGLSHGVIEGLRQLRPRVPELELVHRLDRDTSGCLLVAKRRSLLRWLHQQLRDAAVDKRYLALLAGPWNGGAERVDAPLRKNILQGGERLVRVDPAGRPSLTEFRPLRRFADATLVEARLHSGRTHQIRVHAAHRGSPVLGDDKYGDREANARLRSLGLRRLFLHAAGLRFRWPGGAPFEVTAPVPAELQAVLEKLGPGR